MDRVNQSRKRLLHVPAYRTFPTAIITDDGELIRALTIDPTRNYQPLGGRCLVHNVLQQACTMS